MVQYVQHMVDCGCACLTRLLVLIIDDYGEPWLTMLPMLTMVNYVQPCVPWVATINHVEDVYFY